MKFELKSAYTNDNTLAPFDHYIEDLTNAGFETKTITRTKCFIWIDTLDDLQDLSRITKSSIVYDGDNKILTIYDYYME